MTNWSKTDDSTTTYTQVGDITTTYTEVGDADTMWGDLDFMLYLCTEGERKFIMSEGEAEYLIVQRGIDITDYTEVGDQTTSYIKVEDA